MRKSPRISSFPQSITTSHRLSSRPLLDADWTGLEGDAASSLRQKASMLTELAGATCVSQKSVSPSEPRTTREMESTQRVHSRGEAVRFRGQKVPEGSPPRVAAIPPLMPAPRRRPELDPRGARRKLMAPGLLCLYPTICTSGHRFNRWGACDCRWKKITSNEET